MTRRRLFLVTLAALALLGSACSKGSSKSSAGDSGHPKPGEVFLEPISAVGAHPFTKSVAFAAVPDIGAGFAATSGGGRGIRSTRGSTAGLYAGSGSQPVCDATALVMLLGEHEQKSQAWVDALNTDASLQWSGGAKLSAEDVTTYVGELTSVFVRSDTRVTNHGFVSSKDVEFQSVLQKGTAVLVDAQGMPRVRCASGSPLTATEPAAKPKYRGDEWTGFSQSRLVLVQPATRALDALRIVDIHSREIIEIAPGSGCLCDRTVETTTTTSTTLFDEGATTTTRKPGATATTIKRTTTTRAATTTTAPPVTSPPTTTPATTPSTSAP